VGGGGPVAYLADGREFIVNAFGGNVPDRSITAMATASVAGMCVITLLAMPSSLSHFPSDDDDE